MNAYTALRRSGSNFFDTDMETVELIAHGRLAPISSLDADMLDKGLPIIVRHVANAFGGRTAVDSATLKECVKIARSSFKKLGLPEITEAYRLWAAQKFTALEMYGGQFNATQFGRVLSAYVRYRGTISNAIAREKNNADSAFAMAWDEGVRYQNHLIRVANFPNTVREAIANNRFQRPDQVLATWYDYAEQHDMLNLIVGEKADAWNAAIDAIERERSAHLSTLNKITEKQSAIARFAAAGNAPFIVRSKQILVWTNVLGRELTKPTAATESKAMRHNSGLHYDILSDPEYFVQPEAEQFATTQK